MLSATQYLRTLRKSLLFNTIIKRKHYRKHHFSHYIPKDAHGSSNTRCLVEIELGSGLRAGPIPGGITSCGGCVPLAATLCPGSHAVAQNHRHRAAIRRQADHLVWLALPQRVAGP